MKNEILLQEMMEYYSGDPKRIQHFIKVYEFSKIIGVGENISADKQCVLETAAIVHDIGIKIAEEKYGRCDGKYQEQEGPAQAELILDKLGYDKSVIERVTYLVGHHHTYTNIDGVDYRILVEADFLVNMYEDHLSQEAIKKSYERIFKTETGKKLCRIIFKID